MHGVEHAQGLGRLGEFLLGGLALDEEGAAVDLDEGDDELGEGCEPADGAGDGGVVALALAVGSCAGVVACAAVVRGGFGAGFENAGVGDLQVLDDLAEELGLLAGGFEKGE